MTRRSEGHQASIGFDAAQGPLVATYQTRISDYGDMVRAGGDATLSAYAELYGQVQRRLFADVAAERSAVLLKREYIKEHGIPARMFNAVRVSLEGKVSAVRAAQRLRVDSLDRRRGAIGVDLNADHIAVAETDASGNYVKAWWVPLVTYGKNTHQAETLIGDAVASVVQYAREVGKPIVIEKLDFRQKKAALEGESRRYSRMLSQFQLRQGEDVLHLPGLPGRS